MLLVSRLWIFRKQSSPCRTESHYLRFSNHWAFHHLYAF